MKKLYLLLLVFVAGSVGIQTAQADSLMKVTKAIEVNGESKDQIFKNAHDWVVRHGHLNSDNPNAGVILGTVEIGYPSAPVDRVQYTYVFQMKHEIQNNKDTVTFERIMLKSPKEYILEGLFPDDYVGGGKETPVTSKRDRETAQFLFNSITDNLKDSLQTKGS
jgi:hypothetical protein